MDLIIEKFLEIVIILIAAKTGAELMRRINQPAVIGELIAGIVIGYYGLGLLPYHILNQGTLFQPWQR